MKEPDLKRKKNSKNKRQILTVTYLFVALFLAMMGYTCHYAITNRQELINNSYNGRQEILTAQNTRGTIYAAGGQVLAETQTDEDGGETRVYPCESVRARCGICIKRKIRDRSSR